MDWLLADFDVECLYIGGISVYPCVHLFLDGNKGLFRLSRIESNIIMMVPAYTFSSLPVYGV